MHHSRRVTRRVSRRTWLLAALAVASILGYLLIGLSGNWSYVLERRATTIASMLLVGWAVGMSTVLFQTVTENRILTPAIMGFDALYGLLQTTLVFTLGAGITAAMAPMHQFALEVSAMVVFATVLYGWLFVGARRSVHVLMLAGIIFGVLFRSVSSFLQRLIDPSEFQVLQDRFFASFNRVDQAMLVLSAVLLGTATVIGWRMLRTLDVLTLGRDAAIGLGIDHRRVVLTTLLLVAVMVSVATALVGPSLFFGLLVAHLAYRLMGTYRHRVVVPAAGLLAVIALVGGQTILQRVFAFDTSLSIIIEFLGGLLFIALLLKGSRT